jgi:hypothetical protein
VSTIHNDTALRQKHGICNEKNEDSNIMHGRVFGLEYLPVSIANECVLILNFVNLLSLSSLGMLKFRYSAIK